MSNVNDWLFLFFFCVFYTRCVVYESFFMSMFRLSDLWEHISIQRIQLLVFEIAVAIYLMILTAAPYTIPKKPNSLRKRKTSSIGTVQIVKLYNTDRTCWTHLINSLPSMNAVIDWIGVIGHELVRRGLVRHAIAHFPQPTARFWRCCQCGRRPCGVS